LQSLDFNTILPPTPKEYDNLQPPKVNDVCSRHFHVAELEGRQIAITRKHDIKYRLLPISWLKKMWRPDSFFKNAKRVTFQEMTIPNHYIWLYSDKTILYMVKLTLELSCAMKFEAYPHDTQTCSLKMES
ncbi:glycine receptor subunit alpha-2, partial [Trichonephila clavata]